MATRPLTSKFHSYRLDFRRNDHGHRYSLSGASDDALNPNSVSIEMEPQLPPEWVDISDTIEHDIKKAKTNMRELQKLHNLRLKVKFGDDEAELERDIDIRTHEITRLLKSCENNLKRIATVGNVTDESLTQQERVVRLNVMRSKAAQLQKLSKSFRHCQKDFLIRLKGQEEIGDNFFPDDNLDNDRDQSLSIEEALERGMTESQVQQLQELETHSSEREKEIIHVAQSINDLASIFSELSVLVLEQGTILDRIDYNVEQTLVKVQSGTEELVKADEWSKKSRTIKCIFILLIINILFLLILISKHSGDN